MEAAPFFPLAPRQREKGRALLKGGYGLRRMRYRGLSANRFHFDLVAIAYNLRRAAAITP